MNVSRETLQNNAFLRQLKQIILKRIIQLFARLAEEEPEKFAEVQKVYGTVLKLASVEDTKNRDKLLALTRFTTNQREMTSLDQVSVSSFSGVSQLTVPQYIENKKKGQKQVRVVQSISCIF